MAFCSNCGQKLVDGAKFCSGCGVAVGQVAQAVVDIPKVEHQAPNKEEQRKSFFDGEIHKCPSCGEVLNSFTGNCPACGYELRGVRNANSVEEFVRKMERLEERRNDSNVGVYREKGIFGDVLKIGSGLSVVDQQKINLIQHFPVPNTKEDILEFMIMASSHIKAARDGIGNEKEEIYDAWVIKVEQTMAKAEMSFGDDKAFMGKLEKILERRVTKKVGRRKGFRSWPLIGKIAFVWINFYTFCIPLLIYSLRRK